MKLYLNLAKQVVGDDSDGAIDTLNQTWPLYADVTCMECGKEYSMAYVGGIGGECPRCGGRCE